MKKLICIVCPRGCVMSAEVCGTQVIVTGNGCPRGVAHAECAWPQEEKTVASVCARV